MIEHKKTGIALAAVWIGGMGALAAGTHSSVDTPAPGDASSVYMPASASTSSMQAAGAAATAASAQSVDFIVRFDEKIDAIDRCLELQPNQLPEAQRVFSSWASDKEALRGLVLKKVKFSGEFILTWDAQTPGAPSRAIVDDKLEKIRSLSAVRYADPDYTFQPEGAR